MNILDYKLEDIKTHWIKDDRFPHEMVSFYSYDFIINYRRAMNPKT